MQKTNRNLKTFYLLSKPMNFNPLVPPRRQPVPAWLLGLLMLILPVAALAAGDNGDEPIHIEADRMISQEQDNSVVFIGNVDANQGEITIHCDEMTVYYSQQQGKKNRGGKSSQVKRLICRRNVEITQGDWLGTGQRMDYYARDRKVVLSGDAKAWQGPNMVSGKTIVYYLDEKRSIVEQDKKKSGRVKAVIHPESDAKN